MSHPIANKALGQHYLTSTTVIEKICNNFVDAASEIIEIGPGPTVLTKTLVSHNLPIIVIEKDPRFKPLLEEIINPQDIFINDALRINLTNLLEKKNFSDNTWLVSNLPYNAAAPLLMSFIKTPAIKYMTLMFQKEVGIKTVPLNGDMNSLLAISNNYFSTELLCNVPPGAFAPPPKVDSVVISFTRRDNPVVPLQDFKEYEKILRVIFGHKRKQLGTVLRKGHIELDVNSVLSEINIDPKIRAEKLTMQNITDLFKKIRCL